MHTQPLKILIADDEIEARELLLYYLQEWQSATLREASNGTDALQLLNTFKPDIVFLDIRMPEMTGIEVLQQKADSSKPAVIFTTAFDEYALPAFDYEAVDYLLKPFDKERFDRSMRRAIDYRNFIKAETQKSFLKHLPVRIGSKTDLLNIEHISYFQAEGSYVQVVTNEKTYLISEPIYELESVLDPALFARVHRSVIVRTEMIQQIQSLMNGDHILILKNGSELRASRSYRDTINELKNLNKR
jgi:two-component system, LytTR family, response regulator